MSDHHPTRHKRLLDALTTIAPLAQQLDHAARQRQQDAAALLEATQRAVALVTDRHPKGGA
jgi:hypothetical protein